MVTIRYTEGQGWHSHAIGPREPFQLDPACAVLHYAQEIFEGMKAYRLEDGSIAMFRPEENARRFAASAERMALPENGRASCRARFGRVVLTAVVDVSLQKNQIPNRYGQTIYQVFSY